MPGSFVVTDWHPEPWGVNLGRAVGDSPSVAILAQVCHLLEQPAHPRPVCTESVFVLEEWGGHALKRRMARALLLQRQESSRTAPAKAAVLKPGQTRKGVQVRG